MMGRFDMIDHVSISIYILFNYMYYLCILILFKFTFHNHKLKLLRPVTSLSGIYDQSTNILFIYLFTTLKSEPLIRPQLVHVHASIRKSCHTNYHDYWTRMLYRFLGRLVLLSETYLNNLI